MVRAEVPHLRRLGCRFVAAPEGPGSFVLTEVNRDRVQMVVERLSLPWVGALELPLFFLSGRCGGQGKAVLSMSHSGPPPPSCTINDTFTSVIICSMSVSPIRCYMRAGDRVCFCSSLHVQHIIRAQ